MCVCLLFFLLSLSSALLLWYAAVFFDAFLWYKYCSHPHAHLLLPKMDGRLCNATIQCRSGIWASALKFYLKSFTKERKLLSKIWFRAHSRFSRFYFAISFHLSRSRSHSISSHFSLALCLLFIAFPLLLYSPFKFTATTLVLIMSLLLRA